MKTSRLTRLVNDLAGYWTEPVLEILKSAGKALVAVQSEIETWHTLNAALQSELREQWALGTTSSLSRVKERVFARAFSYLARKHNLRDEHIRQSIEEDRSTTAERRLFQELVREPMTRSAFSSVRQTDFVPRFQMSALAG
jgi:hypothetical protein